MKQEMLSEDIFKIQSEDDFTHLALKIFHYQIKENEIYRSYVGQIGTDISSVKTLDAIPFLPIEFFKDFKVISGNKKEEIIFTSSGTTGEQTSKHFVSDVSLYKNNFRKCFEKFYSSPHEYCILALLPSYLQRDGSSLVYMAKHLIEESKHPQSNFFLNNLKQLSKTLINLQQQKQKTILLGVTYALIDFAEQFPISFPELLVMETGGMKGKRKEMVREEVHEILQKSFGVTNIHSEYGMTELLSQAYSKGKGIFETPSWMRILIRDTNDSFTILHTQQAGGINIIDLANINSCSFIATQDLGKVYPDNSFEVLGRFDNSDIRGCNLLVG